MQLVPWKGNIKNSLYWVHIENMNALLLIVISNINFVYKRYKSTLDENIRCREFEN